MCSVPISLKLSIDSVQTCTSSSLLKEPALSDINKNFKNWNCWGLRIDCSKKQIGNWKYNWFSTDFIGCLPDWHFFHALFPMFVDSFQCFSLILITKNVFESDITDWMLRSPTSSIPSSPVVLVFVINFFLVYNSVEWTFDCNVLLHFWKWVIYSDYWVKPMLFLVHYNW